MKFNEKLKELRTDNQLSLMKLAKQIKVSDATIFKWENEINEPKASYIIALANYFKISTDELLGRENFGTGNIEIIGEQLNDKEKQLLQNFRNLDQDGQTAFLDIIDKISRMYNKTNQNIS